MALSRIWAAFIITAMLVASYKLIFNNDENIFSRMVVGKSDDPYDSVSYVMTGSPQKFNYTTQSFASYIGDHRYKTDSVKKATVLVTDDVNSDSVQILKAINPLLKVYTYRSIQWKPKRQADGIIEAC